MMQTTNSSYIGNSKEYCKVDKIENMGQSRTYCKSKLVIGFFSIASFVVIVGTIGFVNSLHINSALNVVTNNTLPELLVLDNIQSSVNKISSDIVGFSLVLVSLGDIISQYSIIKLLSRLKDAASQITSGNLDFEMKSYTQSDEIGELSIQFDRLEANAKSKDKRIGNIQSTAFVG